MKTKKSVASSRNNNSKVPASKSKRREEEDMNEDEDMEEENDDQDSKLRELFLDSLKDIYWAEKALVKTLPKLSKASSSDDLSDAFDNHLTETQEHVTRLEQVFEAMGEKAQAKKCEAMEGLIKEGEEIMEETDEDTITRDVGLIMAAQKVEHYEIATYGTLRTIAEVLGHSDVAEILQSTLDEEKMADEKLTSIAEGHVNADTKEEER